MTQTDLNGQTEMGHEQTSINVHQKGPQAGRDMVQNTRHTASRSASSMPGSRGPRRAAQAKVRDPEGGGNRADDPTALEQSVWPDGRHCVHCAMAAAETLAVDGVHGQRQHGAQQVTGPEGAELEDTLAGPLGGWLSVHVTDSWEGPGPSTRSRQCGQKAAHT